MRRSVMFLAAALAAPLSLTAQTPYSACNQPLITASQQNINICNAAIDGAEIFHPVAGILVSGGNPVLGSVGTLGGLPHFAITARGNATQLVTPDLDYDGTGTTVPRSDKLFAPAPVIEAAVGIIRGLGPSGFLSIDLLGSASLLPTSQIDGLSVDKDATKIGEIALGLGYGARVGVIRGRGFIPSVTVSAMKRSIPRITYGDVAGGDQYAYSVDLDATNLRAVAGYRLALLNVGVGVGYDKYTSEAIITFEDQLLAAPITVRHDLENSRNLAFLTASLDLPVVKIGAELGYQLGKDETYKTDFQGIDPSANRLFGSAGIRFSF